MEDIKYRKGKLIEKRVEIANIVLLRDKKAMLPRRKLSQTVRPGLMGLFVTAMLSCGQSDDRIRHQDYGLDHRPNIIYILADDLGYGDLGCYGQRELVTPNIDRLAREGMRFTQHYAGSTVCAPSRASLLTGKHAGHINVRGNSPPGQLIKEEEITIAEALNTVGYTSAVIGKWGVGHPPLPDDPIRNGFDHHYGYINMWHAHNFYPEFLYRNTQKESLEGNVTDWSFNYEKQHPNGMPEGTGVAKEKDRYVLDEFETDAISFIEENQHRPFFLFMSLNMPHANNEAGYILKDGMEVPMLVQDGKKIPDYGNYADRVWPSPEKGFAMMIDLIDQFVGIIEQKINDLGLSGKTVIIFSSDNGPHHEGGHKVDFFDSNGALRGSKRDLYEGGIRVPLIVKWPGKVRPSTTSEHICGFHDLLPTFCEMTGAKIPDDIDGISFLPTLFDHEDQKQHEYLYWEFYEQGGKQAARKNNWKYVKLNVRDSEINIEQELYDLSNDISEQDNIIDDHPQLVKEMEAILKEAHTPSKVLSLFNLDVDGDTAF